MTDEGMGPGWVGERRPRPSVITSPTSNFACIKEWEEAMMKAKETLGDASCVFTATERVRGY